MMHQLSLLFLVILLRRSSIQASHYRGGSVSWTIREAPNNTTTNPQEVPVRVTQRHSWRRLYGKNHFCDNKTIATSGLIGQGELVSSDGKQKKLPAMVRCTDFNEQFDYSSGEISASVTLPMNKVIEYAYQGCCWIPLLPPDTDK
ncbi:unnamed protein product, partial [Rotaria sp. Silwood2]